MGITTVSFLVYFYFILFLFIYLLLQITNLFIGKFIDNSKVKSK